MNKVRSQTLPPNATLILNFRSLGVRIGNQITSCTETRQQRLEFLLERLHLCRKRQWIGSLRFMDSGEHRIGGGGV